MRRIEQPVRATFRSELPLICKNQFWAPQAASCLTVILTGNSILLIQSEWPLILTLSDLSVMFPRGSGTITDSLIQYKCLLPVLRHMQDKLCLASKHATKTKKSVENMIQQSDHAFKFVHYLKWVIRNIMAAYLLGVIPSWLCSYYRDQNIQNNFCPKWNNFILSCNILTMTTSKHQKASFPLMDF
jgi:hypothetical protein